jgi:predicted nucleotidyltransferase
MSVNTIATTPAMVDANMRPNRGPFSSEDEALDEMVKRLVRDLDPAAIWLFGSRALGSHRPASDFDLLLVTKDEDGDDAGGDYERAYAPICGLGVGCDVVPCSERDFARARLDQSSFAHHIAQTGRVIYERTPHPKP